jgi:hypothetical protein
MRSPCRGSAWQRPTRCCTKHVEIETFVKHATLAWFKCQCKQLDYAVATCQRSELLCTASNCTLAKSWHPKRSKAAGPEAIPCDKPCQMLVANSRTPLYPKGHRWQLHCGSCMYSTPHWHSASSANSRNEWRKLCTVPLQNPSAGTHEHHGMAVPQQHHGMAVPQQHRGSSLPNAAAIVSISLIPCHSHLQ